MAGGAIILVSVLPSNPPIWFLSLVALSCKHSIVFRLPCLHVAMSDPLASTLRRTMIRFAVHRAGSVAIRADSLPAAVRTLSGIGRTLPASAFSALVKARRCDGTHCDIQVSV